MVVWILEPIAKLILKDLFDAILISDSVPQGDTVRDIHFRPKNLAWKFFVCTKAGRWEHGLLVLGEDGVGCSVRGNRRG